MRVLSLSSGIEASTMHTRETHWFLLTESPTNTNLLFLSFSSSLVALNLVDKAKFRHHVTIFMQRQLTFSCRFGFLFASG
jgi:hypothetical protein